MPGLKTVDGIEVREGETYEQALNREARTRKVQRDMAALASLLMDKIAEAKALGIDSYRKMEDGGERECMRDLYGTMYGFGHGVVV